MRTGDCRYVIHDYCSNIFEINIPFQTIYIYTGNTTCEESLVEFSSSPKYRNERFYEFRTTNVMRNFRDFGRVLSKIENY